MQTKMLCRREEQRRQILRKTLNGSTAESRREEIIKAASRLFCEKGYERTTVRDLADAVDLHSGSLFLYFATKEEIFLAVLKAGMHRAGVILNEQLAKAKTPREKLAAICHGHLTAILGAERDAFTIVLRDWRTLSPESRQQVIALRDEYENHIGRVLDDLVGTGLIPEDTRLFRFFLLGALNWTVQWYRSTGDLTIDDLAEGFLSLIAPTVA